MRFFEDHAGLLTQLERHDSIIERQKQDQHEQHAFKSYLAVFVDIVMHDWPKLLALLLDIIANVKIPVGVRLPAPFTMLSVALGKRFIPAGAISQEHMQTSPAHIFSMQVIQVCKRTLRKDSRKDSLCRVKHVLQQHTLGGNG